MIIVMCKDVPLAVCKNKKAAKEYIKERKKEGYEVSEYSIAEAPVYTPYKPYRLMCDPYYGYVMENGKKLENAISSLSEEKFDQLNREIHDKFHCVDSFHADIIMFRGNWGDVYSNESISEDLQEYAKKIFQYTREFLYIENIKI